MTAGSDPTGQEPQNPHGARNAPGAQHLNEELTDSTQPPAAQESPALPDNPEATQRVSPPNNPAQQVPESEQTQPAVHYPAQQPYDPNLPPLTPEQGAAEPAQQPGYDPAQQPGYDAAQHAAQAPYQQYAQYSQFAQHDQQAQQPQQSYAQSYFDGQHGMPPANQYPSQQPQGPAQAQQAHAAQPSAQPGQAAQGGQAGQGLPPLPQPQRSAQGGDSDLSGSSLVKQTKRPPKSGWRKALYVGTGKLVNPGEGPADRAQRDLTARVQQPLRGCYKIGILSLKGGVGKTTTTTTLGATFASLRGDRVIAVDANPDRGTLSQKIPIETTATVRHLLRDADRITRYSDVRAYTSQGGSRLEILASEQDPAVSEAFSENDYRRTVDLLEHFYNIVLTDCGTGLMHSAMKGVLDLADSLVIVSSGSVDGARSASATLDWLDAHGYGELVQRSITVINSVRPKSGSVDLEKLTAHFSARTRGVVKIPFDPHLEEGAEIDLERLDKNTRTALLELAATVADGFAADRLVR
ncbi:MinD/ParA family protein [Saccharomonospora sp. CUA-673]|uniref:MinD/ParA family ATP-binding protein n=1 Tax=Saccharomonospora sp. CUA-673 TaxID=1904969 RepID=UPI000AC40A64|nr:AAA family ATPase [Saccharomonospora sp. CUA-673]